jgi:CrcB protein
MNIWLGLGVAGAAGAVARYLIDATLADPQRRLPLATLLINVTGSLALGLVTGAVLYHSFPSTPRLWLGTGFCGAYTTFSTFAFQLVELLEDGDSGGALLYAGLSVLGGAAAAIGLAVMAAA